jgi:CDP-4-dehydro-6-deoxyglucose reductase
MTAAFDRRPVTTDTGDPGVGREDVQYRVETVRHWTPVIVELLLRAVDDRIEYRPGQYVLVGDVGYQRPVRSYSLANAPRPDGAVALLVTRVPGGEVSTWLHQLRAGDDLLLSGPYGSFVDDLDQPGPRLYLAGGSGLAPVRALIVAGLVQPTPPPMTLLFSVRTEENLIDHETICRWEREHPAFHYIRTLTRQPGPPPVGHVPDVLPQLVPPLTAHRVFVAGSSGFVTAGARVARRHGADPSLVLTEEFFVEPRSLLYGRRSSSSPSSPDSGPVGEAVEPASHE